MNAIILFTSCYLPENTVDDYEYVMDNLFRWVDRFHQPENTNIVSLFVCECVCEDCVCVCVCVCEDSVCVCEDSVCEDMSCGQVHCGDVGPDGLRELPACVPVCDGAKKQTSLHQVASSVLHIHWQKVRWFHSAGHLCWAELFCFKTVTEEKKRGFHGNRCVTCVSRLKKDLKGLLVVHPAWYMKAMITVVKPFIRWDAHSSKCSSYVLYVVMVVK